MLFTGMLTQNFTLLKILKHTDALLNNCALIIVIKPHFNIQVFFVAKKLNKDKNSKNKSVLR